MSEFGEQLRVPDSVVTVGEAIRWARERRGLTLRQFAAKVGVSAPFMHDVERGRRKPSDAAGWARVLNVALDDLLGRRLRESAEEWRRKNPELAAFFDEMRAKWGCRCKCRCCCPWCRRLHPVNTRSIE